MKCFNCKKRLGGVSITCSYCKNEYCVGCIQLEIHGCECIHLKIEKELKILQDKNVRIQPPKKI